MAITSDQVIQTIRDMIARVDPAPVTLSKPDIKAAITAVDSWATANAASYNQALPEPFKSTASNSLKAALLAYVCLRRAGA